MFSEIQKAEIREMARSLLESQKWDNLPWDDAWNGAFPLRPSSVEIEKEAAMLEEKATRVRAVTSLELEYSTMGEHLRMLHLESARTFDLYRARKSS